MHLCGCPEMGTYEGQVILVAPDRLKEKWPTGIGVDICLALEIQGLWRAGVHTSGHCCGHGRAPAYISVFPESVAAMLAMGYEPIFGKEGHFAPKTVLSPAALDQVDWLFLSARVEADKAMRKFPQPNYIISKVAEEAGEVVKAAIHCAEGREAPENVVAEIRQAMAMLIRLYVEGDQVHGLPALTQEGKRHG